MILRLYKKENIWRFNCRLKTYSIKNAAAEHLLNFIGKNVIYIRLVKNYENTIGKLYAFDRVSSSSEIAFSDPIMGILLKVINFKGAFPSIITITPIIHNFNKYYIKDIWWI